MLHVTNGDAAAEEIRSTGFGGEVLVWRDVLHEGPVPAAAGEAELREIRAGFLARCGWSDRATALADLTRRDERLATALERREEIVLWFEQDLYDQLQLLQVLARIAAAPAPLRVSLVETEGYLGLMAPSEIVAAYARARPVGRPELEAGLGAWTAFRAEDPRQIEALGAGDLEALPALDAALERHLEQFPGITDGLSRSERQALGALAGGTLPFEELFDRAQRAETRRFLGDVVFRWYLEQLAAPPAPLVAAEDDGELWSLTELGRRVLDGDADRLAQSPLDRWLGGVRLLAPRRVYRWDPVELRLVPPG